MKIIYRLVTLSEKFMIMGMQRFEKWTETYVSLLKADQEYCLEPKEPETLAITS